MNSHPAQEYNRVRRIIFSEYHKAKRLGRNLDDEYDKLLVWLKRYKKKIGNTGYVGLSRELSFYHFKGVELSLTPTLDAGDHTDFTGTDTLGRHVRFDVTSNVKPKAEGYDDYSPFLKDFPYVIAELKKNDDEPIYYPLPLPCSEEYCDGRLYHAVVIELDSSVDVVAREMHIIEKCSAEYWHSNDIVYLAGWETTIRGVIEAAEYDIVEVPPEEVEQEYERHYFERSRFYETNYNVNIGAFAERGYHIYGKDDGEFGDRLVWVSNWGREFAGLMYDEIV
ncbi:MAG: hypothetical protein ACXADD_15045 [Candidatus Thorarchaeota archaeon]|jgi:hypothetical protein